MKAEKMNNKARKIRELTKEKLNSIGVSANSILYDYYPFNVETIASKLAMKILYHVLSRLVNFT